MINILEIEINLNFRNFRKTSIGKNNSMNIYSVALNIHDHNTYDGTFHNQIERHNRIKHNLNYEWSHDPNPSKKFFNEFVLDKYKSRDENNIFALTVSNL